MKLAKPKAIATIAYAPTWPAAVVSNEPTSRGSTGMIKPIEIMSISTVAMMNGIAAWRLPEAVRESTAGGWSALTVAGRMALSRVGRRDAADLRWIRSATARRTGRLSSEWLHSVGPVVRGFLRDLHVVHMALADAR